MIKCLGLLKSVFYRISIFINFYKRRFVEPSSADLYFNEQECKVRPQIVNLNRDEPAFFIFSIKTSKWSGSCNNINNQYAKLCVHDIVKKSNVGAFNVMSRNNETRHIEWHKKM